MKFVSVLLPVFLDKIFTYQTDLKLEFGDFVKVPFRNGEKVGIIVNPNAKALKIKDIKWVEKKFNDIPPLQEKFYTFLKLVSEYNLAKLGALFKMSLHTNAVEEFTLEKKIYDNDFSSIKLSVAQNLVCENIVARSTCFNVTLLEGVTGSGKTETYAKLIQSILMKRKQALLLLPEIALLSDIISRLKEYFPNRVLCWHSHMTKKQKEIVWQAVARGDNILLIGARSALFLPFSNLGIIVVDEEHDVSFKQEEGVIYHGRDMAVLRGKVEDVPVLLSSATPSVETLENVKKKKYYHEKLLSRFSGVKLPEIDIIDLKKENMKEGQIISISLLKALIENKNKGYQSLLFLNRRGYAPITLCLSCGHKIKCENCDHYMVEHKRFNKLKCHYCDYKISLIDKCPECKEGRMSTFGIGAEKLEEEVGRILPEAKTIIFSSDVVSSVKKGREIVENIKAGGYDIIIGTQIISKGFNFDKLQLVAIVDLESTFCSYDIRALERANQLIYQVAGRAGRKIEGAKIYIQSYDNEHRLLSKIQKYDFNGFIKEETKEREMANVPPFSSLSLINMNSSNEKVLRTFCKSMSEHKPNSLNIMGPSESPMFYLKNRYRMRFLIVSDKKCFVQNVIKQWLKKVHIPHNVRVKVDIDAYNFN